MDSALSGSFAFAKVNPKSFDRITDPNVYPEVPRVIPVILNDDNMLFLEEPKQNPNPNHMRQFTIRI